MSKTTPEEVEAKPTTLELAKEYCQQVGDWTMTNAYPNAMAEFADRLMAERDEGQPPLCSIHKSLDERGNLVMHFGNSCVACSLNERVKLLEMLEPFALDDSISTLTKLIESYNSISASHERIEQALRQIQAMQIVGRAGEIAEKALKDIEPAKETGCETR